MKGKRYSDEFKEQILREYMEVGNAALVARRHDISKQTIYSWIRAKRKYGSVKPLPREHKQRLEEAERRLKTVSEQNNQLKLLLAEKELELAILRELRDKANPQ
jgi:transposase-like protein